MKWLCKKNKKKRGPHGQYFHMTVQKIKRNGDKSEWNKEGGCTIRDLGTTVHDGS